jgi:ribosomal protein S12 methylthiotransferase accessory factor
MPDLQSARHKSFCADTETHRFTRLSNKDSVEVIFHKSGLKYKRLKDVVPLLVDEDTGIIAYIQELPRQFDMPDVIYYKAEIANTGVFGLQTNRPATGGTSLDRDSAMAKAIGEAVERYSSAIYYPEILPLSTYRNLTQEAVHPDEFVIHTDEQIRHPSYPLQRFDDDTPVRWAWAVRLQTGKTTLVPAAFVYCPYQAHMGQGEAEVAESISTGLAAHCTYHEAAVNGILEVVERDAFMMHWMAKKTCAVIHADSLTAGHRDLIARYRSCGYEVSVLCASTDTGIPTVFCIMHGRTAGSVPVIISSATHLSHTPAITKCLEELALMERLCKRMLLAPSNTIDSTNYGAIIKLADHLKFWMNPEVVPYADFVRSATRTVSLGELSDLDTGDPERDLKVLVELIESTGYHVYICDVTSEDVAALGMSVIRAIIPGYIPLTVQYRCRPEGSRRLLAFIESQQKRNGSSQLNKVPHPFA